MPSIDPKNQIPDDVLVALVALESAPSLWNFLGTNQEQTRLPSLTGIEEGTRTWLVSHEQISSQLERIWPELRLRLEQYSKLASCVKVS